MENKAAAVVMDDKKYIEAGKIINTHGIRGCCRVDSWCDSPAVLAGLDTVYLKSGEEYIPLKIETASLQKHIVLAKFEGCDSFETANSYKNKIIYALRDDIPREEGDIFIIDLIGLPVIHAESGRVYGKLKDVIKGGGGDLYEIEKDGKLAYMPAVSEFVDRVDLEEGIFVRPIEGMLDEI